MNRSAREKGLEAGMSRIQAESFAELTIVRREREQEDRAFAEVLGCAQRFSPRVQAIESPQESSDGAALLLDISNSERLFGSARRIAETLLREIRRLGYEANIAVSGNAHTAMLAAATDAAPAAGAGITIIPCGEEAQALARLPLTVMALEPAQAEMLSAWGVRTVGQLAALPLKPLIARMGEDGDRLHRMARGGFDHLLAPEQEPADAELVERVELEEAVELLEPLLFLMSRALEQLSQRAGERALAIAQWRLPGARRCGALGASEDSASGAAGAGSSHAAEAHSTGSRTASSALGHCGIHHARPSGTRAESAAGIVCGAGSRDRTAGGSAGALAQAGGRRTGGCAGAARHPRAGGVSRESVCGTYGSSARHATHPTFAKQGRM